MSPTKIESFIRPCEATVCEVFETQRNSLEIRCPRPGPSFSCNAHESLSVFLVAQLVSAASRYMRITRSTVLVTGTALLLVFCLALPGSSQAQTLDGLSQLLGGGLLGHNSGSGQSNAPITVERNSAPYTGTFSGKESTASETKSLDAKFACYPAHDPAFDQTDTFICYAAQ